MVWTLKRFAWVRQLLDQRALFLGVWLQEVVAVYGSEGANGLSRIGLVSSQSSTTKARTTTRLALQHIQIRDKSMQDGTPPTQSPEEPLGLQIMKTLTTA